jgi:RNA polymerase primary sigma factor
MVALINQWRHVSAHLELSLGRSPGVDEMADVMNLPLKKAKVVAQIVKVLSSVRDTHGSDNQDEDMLLEATLEDQSVGQPEDPIVAYEEKKKVLALLEEIDPREADILRLHYGLDGCKPLTLRQIGEKLGLTRERIRQILRQALTELYEYMNQ